MKTLYLLRHAKSSWADRSLRDYDRPLAPRGEKAAPAIGTELVEQGWELDHVLCSSAQRTRDTWELMAPLFDPPPEVEYLSELYLAAPETILQLIRYQPDSVHALMVVGHNPGIADTASGLVKDGPEQMVERMERKYPTAALVRISVPVDEWRGVTWRSGRLDAFIRPKDLANRA